MIAVCPALPSAGFIGSMAGYLDCQARVLGSGGWAALAAPGSTLTLVLTGFLTIAIALVGYNLLLGERMTVRSGTIACLKVGAIFALATSWPAYRTLVYDLVTDGPAQLVAEIGPRSGVAGSDGTLVQRLDLADSAMAKLAILGPGYPPRTADSELVPPPFAGFDGFALGGSRILFELAAVAGLGTVWIVAGLMLALGPFFIAFLMFEGTRSLFEGWVRVLGGAALAAVGVSIALGLELALVEPWLSDVLARRMAGEPLPQVPAELFVIACLFAMVVAAALHACMRLVRAFRLAPIHRLLQLRPKPGRAADAPTAAEAAGAARRNAGTEPSRAAAVAAILQAAGRRERGEAFRLAAGPAAARIPAVRASDPVADRPAPVGRSFTRRPASRVSAIAARRDHRK